MHRNHINIHALGAFALLAATCVFIVGCPETPVGKIVPDLTGMTEQQAQDALLAEGLAVGVFTDVFDEAAAAGLVLAQNPVSGALVDPGTMVDLTISQGSVFDAVHYAMDREWDQATYGWASPVGLAVDPAGNLFVADRWNNRVVAFDADGNFAREWGSGGDADGQFNEPYAIDATAAGLVYVADSFNQRVQIFTATGVHQATWRSFDTGGKAVRNLTRCFGVAAHPDDRIYVVNSLADEIVVFNPQGGYLNMWGSGGTGDSEFDEPFGVAVNETTGDVYIGDVYNDRVQRFTDEGVFVSKWGSYGSSDGQFQRVNDVGVDAKGNVYATDQYNHRVQKFTAEGVYRASLGVPTGNPGDLNRPHSVDIDGQGHVYVVDMGNQRIIRFAPQTPPRG